MLNTDSFLACTDASNASREAERLLGATDMLLLRWALSRRSCNCFSLSGLNGAAATLISSSAVPRNFDRYLIRSSSCMGKFLPNTLWLATLAFCFTRETALRTRLLSPSRSNSSFSA